VSRQIAGSDEDRWLAGERRRRRPCVFQDCVHSMPRFVVVGRVLDDRR
jgi:hypothetical protein